MGIVQKASVDFGKGMACEVVIAMRLEVIAAVLMKIQVLWDVYAV
jgi:hypothetical protein